MSFENVRLIAAVVLSLMVSDAAVAREVAAPVRVAETTRALPVGDARPVWGWVDFCRRHAVDCRGARLPARDVRLDGDIWREIDAVNRNVNAAITPETDEEHWGAADRWDLPTDGRGDCEDYVLLKRKLLMERGLPRQALLVTVVIDTAGAGHAILTVTTDHGDFVLDNMRDDIRPWVQTGYRFVKRQSQEDPNRWVAIDDGVQAPAMVSAY